MSALTRVDFPATHPIGPGAFEPVAAAGTRDEGAISRGEVPSTSKLDNQSRLPEPTRPGTWIAQARSVLGDVVLAILIVTLTPLVVVGAMMLVLRMAGALVSLARGA